MSASLFKPMSSGHLPPSRNFGSDASTVVANSRSARTTWQLSDQDHGTFSSTVGLRSTVGGLVYRHCSCCKEETIHKQAVCIHCGSQFVPTLSAWARKQMERVMNRRDHIDLEARMAMQL